MFVIKKEILKVLVIIRGSLVVKNLYFGLYLGLYFGFVLDYLCGDEYVIWIFFFCVLGLLICKREIIK